MIRIDKLVKHVKEMGQTAVAVTDHGWLAGSVKLVQEARKVDIKPIIGSELYLTTAESMEVQEGNAGDQYHLTVLAQNRVGYQNLTKLTTEGHLRGFHYKPRVDKDALERYSEGLIVLSGCWGAEIPSRITQDVHETGDLRPETRAIIEWYQRTFEDRFFFEVMNHGRDGNGISHTKEVNKETGEVILQEHELNDILRAESERTGIPLVATNDAHYLRGGDGQAHDALLCLGGPGGWVTKEDRLRFPGAEHKAWEFYVKSGDEMKDAADLDWWRDACDRTQEVADLVEDEVLQLNQQIMPKFEIPEDEKVALKVWMEGGIL